MWHKIVLLDSFRFLFVKTKFQFIFASNKTAGSRRVELDIYSAFWECFAKRQHCFYCGLRRKFMAQTYTEMVGTAILFLFFFSFPTYQHYYHAIEEWELLGWLFPGEQFSCFNEKSALIWLCNCYFSSFKSETLLPSIMTLYLLWESRVFLYLKFHQNLILECKRPKS